MFFEIVVCNSNTSNTCVLRYVIFQSVMDVAAANIVRITFAQLFHWLLLFKKISNAKVIGLS